MPENLDRCKEITPGPVQNYEKKMNLGRVVDLAAEMALGLVDAIDMVREKYYV
jgi:hypothetical protein